ncbi:MAG: hypothetical protein MJ118_03080, partial [Clostridia bacterium]|nr:hypothetical protein [Clostridia bacterium]
MIVYLREELLSFDHFEIRDEQERTLFTADRELFSFGRKVTLADPQRRQAAAAQHIPISTPSAFTLSIGSPEPT